MVLIYGRDLLAYNETTDIPSIVIINPDKPSGNCISKNELVLLLDCTKKKKITFILDESFADFSEEGIVASPLNKDILEDNLHLIIVKSISKSYGIPGLHLDIITSSNKGFMRFVRKEASIWNINSLGDYFLEMVEKYKDEYLKALEHFKEVCY